MDSAQRNRSLLRRAADFLFGYDFFICYAWVDGRAYAVELEHALEAMGFECFLDSSDYAKGEDWRFAGRRAIRKTSRLILVGSPASLEREPVLREVETFRSTGRAIVPISFGASLFPADRSGPLFQYLSPDILALKEPSDCLATGPTEDALRELRAGFDLQRQDRKRLRWLAATVVTLALLLAASVVAAAGFLLQRREAVRQRDVAAFDAGGERLLVAPERQIVQVVDYSLSNLRRIGCQLAAVNFSREEWRNLVGDARYVCPCPQEPGCSKEPLERKSQGQQ